MTDVLFELLSLDCRVDAYGTVRYYNRSGQLHRAYGPAIEWPDGFRDWFQNGQRHRVDGPAIEFPDGRRDWYQNGLLHRTDGPAIERPDGHRAWYINSKKLSQAEWRQVVANMESV